MQNKKKHKFCGKAISGTWRYHPTPPNIVCFGKYDSARQRCHQGSAHPIGKDYTLVINDKSRTVSVALTARDFSDFFHLNPYKLARSSSIANATNQREENRTTSGHKRGRRPKTLSSKRGHNWSGKKNIYIILLLHRKHICISVLYYYLSNCRDMYISNTFSTSGEV